MNPYLSGPNAVIDLHKKGFENDFQLLGNDLFWVQENLFIRAGEFAILEYHKIRGSKKNSDHLSVFGIIALYHNIKGILIHHYKSYTKSTPPVLIKKLNELNAHAGISNQGATLKKSNHEKNNQYDSLCKDFMK